MLRSQRLVLISFFASAAAQAAIWPPAVQEFSRHGEPKAVETTDPVLREYGIVAAETAEYSAGKRSFAATAWRFRDATGAVAAAQMLSPTATTNGNYVIDVTRGRLSRSELEQVFHDLSEFRAAPKPTLPSYLPKTLESIRYVLGPESHKKFISSLSSAVLDFSLGTEIEVAKAKVGGRDAQFALFRFPTPQIARLKAAELTHAVPSATVKRSGPLVALLWAPDGAALDAKAAETFLGPIEFRAVLIENEANPNQPIRDAAKMVLSIFALAGGLLVICLVGGILMGGIRIWNRRGDGSEGALQTLHLHD